VTENNATPSELKNKKQSQTYNPGTLSGLKIVQIQQVGLSPKPLQYKPKGSGFPRLLDFLYFENHIVN
jgi:hypothetical protein